MLSPNTILRERYRIIQQLGQGGMGAVYQAMDESLSCVVAVKETFATTDEQHLAFRREAQLLANLTHPTLPRVMDHFTEGEGQFLVMQFVPGPTWLKEDNVAAVVARQLHELDGEAYQLDAYCVMSNHVHVVFMPLLTEASLELL